MCCISLKVSQHLNTGTSCLASVLLRKEPREVEIVIPIWQHAINRLIFLESSITDNIRIAMKFPSSAICLKRLPLELTKKILTNIKCTYKGEKLRLFL
jgi:hypothetical protein